MQAHECDQLCDEISSEVCTSLTQATFAARPGVVGALPVSLDAVKAVVRTTLDIAVQFGGPTIEGVVLSTKAEIKEWVSPKVFAFFDGLIHDLQAG